MAVALSPTHITGFFEIRDDARDPLRRGSRGAGICLDLPVITRVEPLEKGVHISINGGEAGQAPVSHQTALRLLELSGSSRGLLIRHLVPVPIGSGFGTSGAAALGVALAGSEVLGLGLSRMEAAQLAHEVEVNLKTGLGTVAAEFYGGLEVRAEPGAPGVGYVNQIGVDPHLSVVTLHNGPLSTPQLLSDPQYRERVNRVGGAFTEELLRRRSLKAFLELSHRFANVVGLATPELNRVMSDAQQRGYHVGMAMFGRTVFTVVEENEVLEVARRMEATAGYGKIIVARIAGEGAHLL